MLQGTGSDVGKSLLVAGLCRALVQRGLTVRPFKPQNMSNNAAVTADGGEIGRAQALQARAARIAPTTDINPVLIKPQSETGAQIIVHGRVVGSAKARDYQAMKPRLMPAVLESFGRLAQQADFVLVEGAGSASEVNLRAGDIANMGFARAVGAPVVLVGDIDRGGVIAQILGTRAAIDPGDAALIEGFIVNKMRGDASLFDDGMRFIAERTRLAPARPRAPLRRGRRACRPRMPWRCRAMAAAASRARRSPSRCRCCRASPISTTSIPWRRSRQVEVVDGAARRAVAGRRPRRASRLQGHHRRPRRLPGRGLGHRPRRPSPARRPRPRPVRRLPDARPGASPIPTASRARPPSSPGSACSTSRPFWPADKHLVAAAGGTVADGEPVAGYEMHVGAPTGRDAARADAAPRRGTRRRRRVAGWPGDGLLPARPVRRRPPARRLARGGWGRPRARRRSPTRPPSRRRSMAFAAHLERHLDIETLHRPVALKAVR